MCFTCDLVILFLSIYYKETLVYEHKNFQNNVHSSTGSNSKNGNSLSVEGNAYIVISLWSGTLHTREEWSGATEIGNWQQDRLHSCLLGKG